MSSCGWLFPLTLETITDDDSSPPVQREEVKRDDELKKVTVIDADSCGMTVCRMPFPFQEEVWCWKHLATSDRCWCWAPAGLCGESSSLSQCIRCNSDVLWGEDDWSYCPAVSDCCERKCLRVCLSWKGVVCGVWSTEATHTAGIYQNNSA